MVTPIAIPLHFLPAFELAAHHLSIRRAAEELHLTPSAVSQQVRALEEALGFTLFRRAPRALHLTPQGAAYAALVRDTLDTYRQGMARLTKQRGHGVIRLSCDSFIAHELLIPELHRMRVAHAGMDLRIETSSALVDFQREAIDAAVRYGRGPWPGLASSTLCSIVATPVCAPGLLPGDRLPARGNWKRYPLIGYRDYPDPWLVLAKYLRVQLPEERLVFDSYLASIRAAEKGLGIAMGLFPITCGPVLEASWLRRSPRVYVLAPAFSSFAGARRRRVPPSRRFAPGYRNGWRPCLPWTKGATAAFVCSTKPERCRCRCRRRPVSRGEAGS